MDADSDAEKMAAIMLENLSHMRTPDEKIGYLVQEIVGADAIAYSAIAVMAEALGRMRTRMDNVESAFDRVDRDLGNIMSKGELQ